MLAVLTGVMFVAWALSFICAHGETARLSHGISHAALLAAFVVLFLVVYGVIG